MRGYAIKYYMLCCIQRLVHIPKQQQQQQMPAERMWCACVWCWACISVSIALYHLASEQLQWAMNEYMCTHTTHTAPLSPPCTCMYCMGTSIGARQHSINVIKIYVSTRSLVRSRMNRAHLTFGHAQYTYMNYLLSIHTHTRAWKQKHNLDVCVFVVSVSVF